ncbi:MAG: response regulator [Gemmatimonadetes bacterium]|nr:response regulator [Gemmatimonadota bacterium]
MLERLIGEHIQLEWHPGDGLWPVFADASQVDQIIANLCVNAKDAIADVGTLRIATENCVIDDEFAAAHADAEPGRYVRLSVSDTGHGMSNDVMAHIFEPFFTTKGVGEGTGLGLATVYGAVRQNHGFITVSSRVGQGSVFEIHLPQYEGARNVESVDHADVVSARGHETILVVEDEASLLRLTTRVLEHSGYAVLTASSPATALDLAKAHAGDIHLLLTDVVMPGMNGGRLASAVRAHRPNIQWLYMSGYASDVVGDGEPFDDATRFIGKPFSTAALTAKVREVLDRV